MYDMSRLFHIGIRVADLDLAMDQIGSTMGVTWASVQSHARSAWVPGVGQIDIPCRLTYSVEGPVHYELLEGPPGSIWDGTVTPGPHHYGVWSDDVKGDTERLLVQGWTLELAALSPEEGYGRLTYVRSPSGFLLEPVSIVAKPRFERWWAGGSLQDPPPPSA
jgi:Glyoxalase/Bleomycin resistance protein/Dioxygenase superfamily